MLPRAVPSLARPAARTLLRGSLRPAMATAARAGAAASHHLSLVAAPLSRRSFALSHARRQEEVAMTPGSLFNFTEEELMLRESG